MPSSKNKMSTTARHFAEARAGDAQALADLFKRIHQRLYRFSLYLTGDPSLAADLTQDAYVKAIEHIPSLEMDPQFFMPWLFRVTRNAFLDYVRSPKNRASATVADFGEALASIKADTEAITRINEGLRRLSAEDRYLFLLVYLENASYGDAARITAIPETTLRNRLHRIRKGFRDLFTATHSGTHEK